MLEYWGKTVALEQSLECLTIIGHCSGSLPSLIQSQHLASRSFYTEGLEYRAFSTIAIMQQYWLSLQKAGEVTGRKQAEI